MRLASTICRVLTLSCMINVVLQAAAGAQPSCPEILDGLPDGASLSTLACVEAQGNDDSSIGLWTFHLERTELQPGESLAPKALTSLEHVLIYVESGELTLFDASAATEEVYASGSQALIETQDTDGSSYAVRNDGTTLLTYLRLSWETGSLPNAGAAVADVTDPVDSYPRIGDSAPEMLAHMDIPETEVPSGPAVAFVARLTLAPNTSLAEQRLEGPITEIVEVGELAIRQYSSASPPAPESYPSSGIAISDGEMTADSEVMAPTIDPPLPVAQEVTLPSGQYLVVPAYTPHVAQNSGSAPVTVLIAGLLPSPLTSDSNVLQGVPSEFNGTWQGTGFQVNPDGEWPMVVELHAEEDLVIGTVSYPTLGCEGEYVLRGIDGTTLSVFENITEGNACIDGQVTLRLSDGMLIYTWQGERTTVTASLIRVN